MEFQPMKYIYQPASKPGAGYTLLLLHGTGGDERDLLSLSGYFGEDVNVLSLRGNVSEHGMPRFFKRLGMGVFDEDDLRFRTEEMVAFVQSLAEQEGFSLDKIVALGYSNGANIAGSALWMHPGFLAGAILYRPMQPYKQLPAISLSSVIPVFASNATADPTINPVDTTKYLAVLEQAGYRVEALTVSGGHGLTAQDVERSVEWFNRNFRYSIDLLQVLLKGNAIELLSVGVCYSRNSSGSWNFLIHENNQRLSTP